MTCIRHCLQIDVRNTVLVRIFSNSHNGRTSNIFCYTSANEAMCGHVTEGCPGRQRQNARFTLYFH